MFNSRRSSKETTIQLLLLKLQLHPIAQIESVTCIAQDLTKALSEVLVHVFPKTTSPEEVCDTFRSEWRLYQTEEIKEEYCYSTTPVVSG